MDTNTEHTGPEAIEEARRLLAEHEAAQRAAQEEAERRRTAEDRRQAERRKLWAEKYLASNPDAEIAEARKAARAAKLAFGDALAESPWFQAMIEWQQREFDVYAASQRRENARAVVEEREPRTMFNHGQLVTWIDGSPSFQEFWRVVDGTLRNHATFEPMAQADRLIAGPDGHDDPLTQTS